MRLSSISVSVATILGLAACSNSGGGSPAAASRPGVVPLNHQAGACIQLNGTFVSSDGSETIELRTSPVPGGVKITTTSAGAEPNDMIFDGRVHGQDDESTQGACDNNALRLNLISKGKVLVQMVVTLSGANLSIVTTIVDPELAEKGAKGEQRTYQKIR